MRIIVTGSEGLIGKSIVEFLISSGHECLCLDYSNGDDLTDEEYVRDYFKNNKAECLINLFALNHHVDNQFAKEDLFNITLESFRQYMETNLTALFSVCREFARNNSAGKIINFSSTYGVVSPRKELYEQGEKHIGYSVSKAGVLMLSKHLATHLAPQITVNAVIPGGVLNNQDEEFIKKYSLQTPLLQSG